MNLSYIILPDDTILSFKEQILMYGEIFFIFGNHKTNTYLYVMECKPELTLGPISKFTVPLEKNESKSITNLKEIIIGFDYGERLNKLIKIFIFTTAEFDSWKEIKENSMLIQDYIDETKKNYFYPLYDI